MGVVDRVETPNSIALKVTGHWEEGVASEAITPGMLIEVDDTTGVGRVSSLRSKRPPRQVLASSFALRAKMPCKARPRTMPTPRATEWPTSSRRRAMSFWFAWRTIRSLSRATSSNRQATAWLSLKAAPAFPCSSARTSR